MFATKQITFYLLCIGIYILFQALESQMKYALKRGIGLVSMLKQKKKTCLSKTKRTINESQIHALLTNKTILFLYKKKIFKAQVPYFALLCKFKWNNILIFLIQKINIHTHWNISNVSKNWNLGFLSILSLENMYFKK